MVFDMERLLITVLLTVFFILMSIFLIVAIVDGILYAIHPKSDRIFSIFVYCNAERPYFTLYYKMKKIDDLFVYGKYKRHYYFVGKDGIYKLKNCLIRISKVQEDELQKDEKDFISDMIKERIAKVKDSKDLLESFISKYEK